MVHFVTFGKGCDYFEGLWFFEGVSTLTISKVHLFVVEWLSDFMILGSNCNIVWATKTNFLEPLKFSYWKLTLEKSQNLDTMWINW